MTKRKGLSLSDLERRIADQVIDMMKTKGLKWVKGWQVSRPACNGLTGHTYRGSNILNTWIWLMLHEQSDPRFIPRSKLFPKDGTAPVGKVRKGEKGIPIVYYDSYTKENEQGEEKKYRFAKIHYVWHVSQIDDLDHERLVDPMIGEPPATEIERHAQADLFIHNVNADLRFGGDQAYFAPARDYVQMPEPERFKSAEYYYSTLLHEFTHWTGHETRLKRFETGPAKTQDYAFEELVAELGSVLLGVQLGVQIEPDDQNASYLKAWLKKLGDDPRYIFDAMREASKAAQYLTAMQPDADDVIDDEEEIGEAA